MFIKRPKATESEIDILKEQENFISKNKLESKDKKSLEKPITELEITNTMVLGDIVERNISSLQEFKNNKLDFSGVSQVIFELDKDLIKKSKPNCKSLFAQQLFKNQNLPKNTINCSNLNETISDDNKYNNKIGTDKLNSNQLSDNLIAKLDQDDVKGTDISIPILNDEIYNPMSNLNQNLCREHEKSTSKLQNAEDSLYETLEKIDAENRTLMQNMTKVDIANRQKEILQNLDPSIVEFLRNRNKIKAIPSKKDQKLFNQNSEMSVPGLNCTNKQNVLNIIDKVDNHKDLFNTSDEIIDKSIYTNESIESKSINEADLKNNSFEDSNLNDHSIKNINIESLNINRTDIETNKNFSLKNEEISEEYINILSSVTYEKEKLKWTGDIPKKTDINMTKSARFNFDGNLIPFDEEVPVYFGLHHHGEEENRAGYTLQELYILARSLNMQQRKFALDLLAKITFQAKQGKYIGRISCGIIPTLLNSGYVMILRWALDSPVESTIISALYALRNLLFNDIDEDCLKNVLHWNNGLWQPCLSADNTDKSFFFSKYGM